jgi:non-specific serine/threonine protein kinase
MLAHEAGEHARATAYLEEALAVGRREGNQFAVAAALACLALVAQAQGDRNRAVGLVTEAIQHTRELGSPNQDAWCAYVAVRVSAEWAPAAVLARVLGALDPAGPEKRLLLSPHEQVWYSQTVATLRATLGEEAFDGCWAAGHALSVDQLVEEALAALEARPTEAGGLPTPPRPPRSKGLLSPREQEVLPLVAEGLTNEEIAERLVISRSTAKYHLISLLQKLGADNRTQAVAHARQRGLL